MSRMRQELGGRLPHGFQVPADLERAWTWMESQGWATPSLSDHTLTPLATMGVTFTPTAAIDSWFEQGSAGSEDLVPIGVLGDDGTVAALWRDGQDVRVVAFGADGDLFVVADTTADFLRVLAMGDEQPLTRTLGNGVAPDAARLGAVRQWVEQVLGLQVPSQWPPIDSTRFRDWVGRTRDENDPHFQSIGTHHLLEVAATMLALAGRPGEIWMGGQQPSHLHGIRVLGVGTSQGLTGDDLATTTTRIESKMRTFEVAMHERFGPPDLVYLPADRPGRPLLASLLTQLNVTSVDMWRSAGHLLGLATARLPDQSITQLLVTSSQANAFLPLALLCGDLGQGAPVAEVRRRAGVVSRASLVASLLTGHKQWLRLGFRDVTGRRLAWFFGPADRMLLLVSDPTARVAPSDDGAVQAALYAGLPEDMLLLVTDVDDDDLLTSVRNDAEPRSVAWVRAGAVMWFDGTLWRMTQGVHDHLSAHGLELDDTGLAGLLDLYHFDHPEPPDELLGNLRVTQLTDHLGVQQPARPSRFDDAYAAILPEVEQSTEEMDMEHRTVSLQDADGWYLDFEPGRVVSGHVHISDSRVLATDVAQAVELAHRFMIGDLDWVRRRLWRTPEETSDYLS